MLKRLPVVRQTLVQFASLRHCVLALGSVFRLDQNRAQQVDAKSSACQRYATSRLRCSKEGGADQLQHLHSHCCVAANSTDNLIHVRLGSRQFNLQPFIGLTGNWNRGQTRQLIYDLSAVDTLPLRHDCRYGFK